MELKLTVEPEYLSTLSRLDKFQGHWVATTPLAAERRDQIEQAVRIQSIGASCRLAGIRVSDAEVAGILRGDALVARDARDVLGYAAAIEMALPAKEALLTSETLRQLHAVLLGGDGAAAVASPWRQTQLHREVFDHDGRATGRIFATLPPHMIEAKTEDVLTWLELELRTAATHPVLAIAAFGLCLLAASPFERGNGRLVRLLTARLLARAGYDFVRYASLEAQMEELRDEYYQAFDDAQTHLWSGDADVTPWLRLFLEVMNRHLERVEVKVNLERNVRDYPPLQQRILETVREHGSVDAGLLIRATGANRNTLKDNLRRLVEGGVLERTGQRRGARYSLASPERSRGPSDLSPRRLV